MLLQTCSSSSPLLQHLPLPHSKTPLGFNNPSTLLLRKHPKKNNLITCYIPQVYNYDKDEGESKPRPRWNIYYRRISLMRDPEQGASVILNQLEKEGKKLLRWELCRVAKQLRKFRKSKLALEVYEWMVERDDRFILSSGDAAVHLDLISKVHGVPRVEEYFSGLAPSLKDKRTYGSLLNVYVNAKMGKKAEALLEEMKSKGFASHPLPYNLMMTLYMKLQDYEKPISLVSEMMEKNIPFDSYTYNIWLTACGAMGSAEEMEEVLERMKTDGTVALEWATYSTVATIYTKLGDLSKAKINLRMLEGKITGRERVPFHFLISLYGGIGEKDDVYRIWNTYKSSFPSIPNMGYHTMIAALLRLDDVEGAEKIYAEWLPVRSSYDPKVCNLLISWYIKNGLLEKADNFLGQVLEGGGKVNAYTWSLLVDRHFQEEHIPEVLSCMKQAMLAEGGNNWKPRPSIVPRFLSTCEEKSDMASKKEFINMMRQAGCFEDDEYMSKVKASETDFGLKKSVDKDRFGSDDESDSGADMLLNQLQGSL